MLQPIREFIPIETACVRYASDLLEPKPKAFDVNSISDIYYTSRLGQLVYLDVTKLIRLLFLSSGQLHNDGLIFKKNTAAAILHAFDKKVPKAKIDIQIAKVGKHLDEISFEVLARQIHGSKLGSKIETYLNNLLSTPSPLHRQLISEPHVMSLQNGFFPRALLERQHILSELFKYRCANSNSHSFSSFLDPLLHSLDLVPTIIPLKDAYVMHSLICQPLYDSNT